MSKKHEHDCTAPDECALCRYGEEVVSQWETDQLIQHGWYMHIIIDDGSVHTHGLLERFHHPDIEMMIAIDHMTLAGIIDTTVDRIKAGEKFEVGKYYRRIIKGLEVTFVKAKECDREVLRLILPDRHGNLDEDQIEDGPFKDQYIGAIR